MPRRVEDILPNDKRSIRNIPIGSKSAHAGSEGLVNKNIATEPARKPLKNESFGREVPIKRVMPLSPPPYTARADRPKRRKGKGLKILLVFIGAIIVVGFGGYAVSAFFSRAIFTVMPREIPISVDGTYIFNSTAKSGTLSYNVIKESDSVSANVPASDGSTVETKAKGVMTVYNAYSLSARRLIAGTRFDSGNGKIYRLTGSIMIPGYAKSPSGQIIPGHIDAPIIADQAGDDYNITGTDSVGDFKIVAYKGTDKYDTIYGRIAGTVTGGFAGQKKTVAKDILASTTAALEAQLTARLQAKISGEISSNFVIYGNGYLISFSEPAIAGGQSDSATVTISGTAYGIELKKDELVARLANGTNLDSFKGMPYDTPGLDQLSFSISNAKDFSPAKGNPLVAELKGTMKVVGRIPVDELKAKFAGLSLSGTNAVMRQYSPVIDLAKSSGQVVPPWAKVPTNFDKISIIVEK
ncbi:hypothetical protein KGQ27_00995 [Patescibacteria group bacterium]|nr:hypothetical protein [Patescibacteria group bacterium]MDE1946578.1 hypothetical protein [Patescibacteria group bacterium]MDE2010861.1 hypothetical protein [Patescibacteria group bacterium]MDE2233205.1 hypothetical protein [Patescibacteria group bacterium]